MFGIYLNDMFIYQKAMQCCDQPCMAWYGMIMLMH